MFVCIVKERSPNISVPISSIGDKTADEIISDHKISTQRLLLCTPFYRRLLGPCERPTMIEPNLKLAEKTKRYPPPSFYLRQAPSDTNISISIAVKIKTQTDIEFTPIFVSLTDSEVHELTVSSFLAKCSLSFEYDCTNQVLMNGDEILDGDINLEQLMDMTCKGNLIYSCVLGDSSLKPIKHRIYLCQQIVESEEFYVKTLQTLVSYFKPKFDQSGIFTEEKKSEIFKNIPSMISAHEQFLSALKLQKISFAQTVTDVFLNFIPFFRVSSAFISNFKNIDSFFMEKNKSRSFSKNLQEIEADIPDGSGRTFMQFYVAPVQRYPKYTLLLRDLDKRTPKFHPDKEYLEFTLEELTTVNGSLDSSSYEMQKTYMMNEIQNELGANYKLLVPRRKLMVSCYVLIRTDSDLKGCAHIFTDILLITEKKKQTQTVILDVPLLNLHFEERGDSIFFNEIPKVNISFLNDEDRDTFKDSLMNSVTQSFSTIDTNSPFCAWELVSNAGIPIYNHAGCLVNGRAIFVGGMDAKNEFITCFIKYNINSNKWSREPCPVPPRIHHSLVAVGTKAYLAFGRSQSSTFSDIWKYDQITGFWDEIKIDTPILPRYGHSCVTWGNKLIFFGGMSPPNQFLSVVSVFDTITNEFYDVETLNPPNGRMLHVSFPGDDDQMIVAYGNSNMMFVADLYILNLKKMEWSFVQIPPHPDMLGIGFSVVRHGRYAYLVGGSLNNKPIKPHCIDLLTLQNFKVKHFGNFTPSCVDTSIVLDGDILYVYGGRSSSKDGTTFSSLFRINLSIGEKELPIIKPNILCLSDLIEPIKQEKVNMEMEKAGDIDGNSNINETKEEKHIHESVILPETGTCDNLERIHETCSETSYNTIIDPQKDFTYEELHKENSIIENFDSNENIDSKDVETEEKSNTEEVISDKGNHEDRFKQEDEVPIKEETNNEDSTKEEFVSNEEVGHEKNIFEKIISREDNNNGSAKINSLNYREDDHDEFTKVDENISITKESITISLQVEQTEELHIGKNMSIEQEMKQTQSSEKPGLSKVISKPIVNDSELQINKYTDVERNAVTLGDDFNIIDFFRQLNIDDNQLIKSSKIVTRRKAQGLWQQMKSNDRLQNEIIQMKLSVIQDIREGTVVYCKVTKKGTISHIIKYTIGEDISAIKEKIHQLYGSSNININTGMQLSPLNREHLSPSNVATLINDNVIALILS